MSTPVPAAPAANALMPAAAAASASAAAAPAVVAPSPAPRADALPSCDNCGASVPGRYCGTCGQRLEPPIHSLGHFLRVAAEDLTHADSRLWRTLAALLVRPGYLTREFLTGRRVRYLPPVRLYLVLSVVFFLWFGASHPKLAIVQIDTQPRAASGAAVVGGREFGPLGAARPGESPQQRAERLCPDANYQGPWQDWIAPRVAHACRTIVLDNGRSVREAFLRNLPRAMFLFLPLLAAAMMLMYWRPRHYYVEHLLLFVHNHAFVFLLLLLAAGVSALLPIASSWVRFLVCLWIPWYMFRSMRVVYAQGRWLTFAKLAMLSFFYLLSGSLMLALITAYSALTL